MTKTIDTLVEDIYDVVSTKGGWDATITEFTVNGFADLFRSRFEVEQGAGGDGLRMSRMGSPCRRKLWYEVNSPDEGQSLPANTLLKFIAGDVWEQLLLSLAIAAGHDVRGMQDELEIAGIKGHRDAVIDGITVDVKSAAPFSFNKFRKGDIRSDDPFGYITQLGAYVEAGHRADESVHPTRGAFLVVDKVTGDLHLHVEDFQPEELDKTAFFERTKEMVANPEPPERSFAPVLSGYRKGGVFHPDGNTKLGTNCSYCPFKRRCWPELRSFQYARSQVHFVEVTNEPRVEEIVYDED